MKSICGNMHVPALFMFMGILCTGMSIGFSSDIADNVPTKADSFSLTEGKAIFMKHCKACHGTDGQGSAGPNLCDPYWIHGNHYRNIYHVIHHGVIDKGMPQWNVVLSRRQQRDVAHYVHMRLRGSKPANAKAPEGKLYKTH